MTDSFQFRDIDGGSGSWAEGDWNGDGVVDGEDFDVWRTARDGGDAMEGFSDVSGLGFEVTAVASAGCAPGPFFEDKQGEESLYLLAERLDDGCAL